MQDLHYVLERARDPETEDVVRQGIVPMETPFLMDQVILQPEQTKNYAYDQWAEDMKKLL